MQLAPAPAPGGQQESFHDSSVSRITPACSPAVRRGSWAGGAACFTMLSGLLSVPTAEQCTFFMCIKSGGVHWHPTHTSMRFSLSMLFHVAGEPPRAALGGRGKEAVPNPTKHPPGFPAFSVMKARGSSGQIAYFARKHADVSRILSTSNVTVSPGLT